MTTMEAITGPGLTIVMVAAAAWAGGKIKVTAAWKALAESRQGIIETRDVEMGDLRKALDAIREENKALVLKIADLQNQITKLEARPDYAGIQGHLDAIEARNISRDETFLAQLVAMTTAIVKLAEERGPRTVRTRKTDAVKS